ncbi:uncharacterized protein LOC106650389 [Trichogramma pretiosum]|uniref:uncharacterized protein LOC106650389 n=1 Tax=Trichogramma pretiosum TaxID=7493 RepID=UPI0006C9E563|nr:uncharacterized protein LOC106650389 [Trichogramma pretiosum]
MDPAIFPEEIWIKILLGCDVPDIIAFGSTCKYLRKTSDTDYLWKLKWLQLTSKVNFQFPDVKSLQVINVSFKAMCYRLHMMMALNESTENMFPKCCYCSGYTCQKYCTERSSTKVVIEIGNKYTWVITPNFGLRRHCSMLGFPKYNKQMTHVEQVPSQLPPQSAPSSSCRRKLEGKFVSKKSLVKLLKLSEPESTKLPPRSGPFCVFCNSVQLYREKRRLELHPNDASCCPHLNANHQKLINGYCTDTKEILGIPNIDLLNPAQALLMDGSFSVLKDFVDHLFRQMGLTETLRKPNTVLMLCEPLGMSISIRKQLLHYLFQEVKIAKVCLVPKPLSACAMIGIDTCIVIDSGALSTSVAVIINNRVVPSCWKIIPVGGWHVAYYLKQAMNWQPKECQEIPISYLDSPTVKERCRLLLDMQDGEFHNRYDKFSKGGQSKPDKVDIDIRVDTYANCKRDWRVTLGSELYTAPELMYVSMNLPEAVKEVTKGLPEIVKKECLSHILLTGGNTDLPGFELRLRQDLKKVFPEYAPLLEVKGCLGTHCWNVVMGSLYVPLSLHPDKIAPEYSEGCSFTLSREKYILFGCESLDEEIYD